MTFLSFMLLQPPRHSQLFLPSLFLFWTTQLWRLVDKFLPRRLGSSSSVAHVVGTVALLHVFLWTLGSCPANYSTAAVQPSRNTALWNRVTLSRITKGLEPKLTPKSINVILFQLQSYETRFLDIGGIFYNFLLNRLWPWFAINTNNPSPPSLPHSGEPLTSCEDFV